MLSPSIEHLLHLALLEPLQQYLLSVPEKTHASLQSTTAPPAEEVRVHIPMDDPHQHMIINSCSSKQQTIAPTRKAHVETTNDMDDLYRAVMMHLRDEGDNFGDLIRRVPMHMCDGRSRHLYEPVMVSIGPYHHNNTRYSQMERFKKCELNIFMEQSVAEDEIKDRNFYYGKIFERIKEIRGYYQGVGPDKYTDKELTELILCDACFLVSYMKSPLLMESKIFIVLGNISSIVLVEHDLLKVENQIPFVVINHLLHLRFGEDEVQEIVRSFVSYICYKHEETLKRLSWNEYQPLHLLDACQAPLLKQENASEPTTQSGEPHQCSFDDYRTTNGSVMYLQTKGIYLKRSSACLHDIKFTSYRFFGVLHLPFFYINNTTLVLLQNIVAFEFSQEGMLRDVDLVSYVNFMNGLIDTAKDVKHLRERGILYSVLENDEEVLKVFKQIHTYGMVNCTVYEDVKRKINKHCQSRSKTWIADLFQNYCRGPWGAIGILSATAVLCLTATQVYYAVHPKH